MCEESDIKEMGIPMGPRKKLQSFIKLHKTRKVRKFYTIRSLFGCFKEQPIVASV